VPLALTRKIEQTFLKKRPWGFNCSINIYCITWKWTRKQCTTYFL